MQCPRCDGRLSTFSVEATGETAVVCEDCGFVGVAATHEGEQTEIESWDRAISRFERTERPQTESCETGRTEAVSVPTDGSTPAVDSDAFEERVTVDTALDGSSEEESPDTDPDALEESVAVAVALEESPTESADDS